MDGEGFLITAYPCDKIKEGDGIWPTSVIHHPIGETLTVYWDDPEHEEVGQGIILIKDARREVSGFERVYFKSSTAPHELGVVLQTARP